MPMMCLYALIQSQNFAGSKMQGMMRKQNWCVSLVDLPHTSEWTKFTDALLHAPVCLGKA